MPFIRDILEYDSLSIVGLEKNTGKTECLNYILRRLSSQKCKVAVTSIGMDGESTDQVTRTAKPEIRLTEGMYFSTAEIHYRSRNLLSELVDITDERSSLGRIVTAKVLIGGNVLLSGPSSGTSLIRWMKSLDRFGVDLKIIDGALSRISSASPAVSRAMVLSTGAAYSANLDTLVRKTRFMVELINIPLADSVLRNLFINVERGVWGTDKEGRMLDLGIASSLTMDGIKDDPVKRSKVIYISGALTDRFLQRLADSPEIKGAEVIVRDFTKLFVSETAYRMFLKRGGQIKVLQKSKLIAVCVNPTAPSGYVLDSEVLCRRLEQEIKLPVYDVVKNKYDLCC